MRLIVHIMLIISSFSLISGQDQTYNQLDENVKRSLDFYHEKPILKDMGEFQDGQPKGVFNYYAIEGHLSAKGLNTLSSSGSILTMVMSW